MRVLMIHNAYQQYGGEDAVVANEKALLEDHGHEVRLLMTRNDVVNGARAVATAALGTIYSRKGRELVSEAIQHFSPDVAHVHNHFPLISPSMFDATAAAGVPSIWTLHNFRVTCANGLLFRDGQPCEACLGRSPIPGVLHRCYRGSVAGSALVSASIGYHRARGTWRHKVNRFIALSKFARGKLETAGIPSSRLRIKPNFVCDPGSAFARRRYGFLYVGRISREKGVETLVQAWPTSHAPLTLIGDGPELPRLRRFAGPNVRFLGHQDKQTVYGEIAGTQALIVPSRCYEGLPMIVLEAMALATPVVASRIGTLAEIVENNVTGYLFKPGDVEDLRRVIFHMREHPDELPRLGAGARLLYESSFTPSQNINLLTRIYEEAIHAPL